MKILNKKQIVERYGADKYYEIQEWLHGDGAPTKDMLRRTRTIMLGEDYDEPTQIEQWGTLDFHRDCFGYVYVVDSAHPSEIVPAIFMYHNFGDRNNYVPDVR